MRFKRMIALGLCLLSTLGSAVWIIPCASGEPEDRQSSPTYDQLSPEEFAKTMPKPEKVDDTLKEEINRIQKQRYAAIDRMAQIDRELLRLDKIERLGAKQLFDDFTKKKVSYHDYETGASPGKLQKERAALLTEKSDLAQKDAALFKKEQSLEREWIDYVQIRIPDSPPYTSPTGDKGLKKVFQQQIAELQKELSVEIGYLQNAQAWASSYPESQTSVAYQQKRVDEIKAQLKEAEEGLRLLEKKKKPDPDPGQTKPSPSRTQPSRKALTDEEKTVWKKKGFSDIEIKTLYHGGIVTDETGHIISGWPPSSPKRKLSFADRLKKMTASSK